ncbi:SIR2 family protein [Ammoniphilus sp. 3BR4]|uniref:SIR2 family protein n=1 Tax=Ammoniphilus sp. 3BR4 TaxID=3158265 RepID=UPI003467C146
MKIRKEFVKGNLTLFCGAGVSADSGIPVWNHLLKHLLGELFVKKVQKENISHEKLAEIYLEYFKRSPLIVLQYLKIELGNDFLHYVRRAIYQNQPRSNELMDVIVELCRPQRERKSLHSIVTFNFDDVVEQNLEKNKIRYKSISKEGERYLPSELPIYHVHGFLPREGDLSGFHIVSSEDAYHSQFIDPFSWSNLVQLNLLNQNLCLFIGLSMTDPNLRRLLDVSMRKKPDKILKNHYIFKKRYNESEVRQHISEIGIKDEEHIYTDTFIRLAEMFEEQDANNLGLNVIWVNDFQEIPFYLGKLIED